MKSIKVLFLFSIVFTIISCKKEIECSWSMAYLNGKTYQLTRVDSLSNGTYKDITTTYLSDPCNQIKISFFESTFTKNFGSGCTNQAKSGNCATVTENGKTFLVNYGVNPFKDEILNFKCETFQAKNDYSTLFYFTKK